LSCGAAIVGLEESGVQLNSNFAEKSGRVSEALIANHRLALGGFVVPRIRRTHDRLGWIKDSDQVEQQVLCQSTLFETRARRLHSRNYIHLGE